MAESVATPKLLSTREVAHRLAVSERTIRRLIASGHVPAIRRGGKGSSIRVDERELESVLYGASREAA